MLFCVIVGYGVFVCDKHFNKGDFLLHYRGELIDIDEADHREHSYDPKYGSFVYFFSHAGKIMW